MNIAHNQLFDANTNTVYQMTKLNLVKLEVMRMLSIVIIQQFVNVEKIITQTRPCIKYSLHVGLSFKFSIDLVPNYSVKGQIVECMSYMLSKNMLR